MLERIKGGAVELSAEGELPDLGGATAWLNSESLTPAGLRGKVVVVQFCTYSCVNWLRTLPYVRAWAQKYRDHGLVVVGAHSPEFQFEHDVEKVRPALKRWASTTRSRSTTTSRSGALSITTPGPPSTSSTSRGESAITTSARRTTSARSGSSNSC